MLASKEKISFLRGMNIFWIKSVSLAILPPLEWCKAVSFSCLYKMHDTVDLLFQSCDNSGLSQSDFQPINCWLFDNGFRFSPVPILILCPVIPHFIDYSIYLIVIKHYWVIKYMDEVMSIYHSADDMFVVFFHSMHVWLTFSIPLL